MLIPLARQNAILVATSKARAKDVLREIEQLDVRPSAEGRAVAFPLRRAVAWRVASQIQRDIQRKLDNPDLSPQERQYYQNVLNKNKDPHPAP